MAQFVHYIDPADLPSVKKQGLWGLEQLLRHGSKAQRRKARAHLGRYERFLMGGEKPTTKNLLAAIIRARKHPRGADRIYGLQEEVDLEKGNDALRSWMGGKLPVKVDVDALRAAGLIEEEEQTDAPPIDYSKLGDKIVFRGIPHPNILTRTGRIPPEYLKTAQILSRIWRK